MAALQLVVQPSGLPFDVLPSKLRIPEPRPGSIWRTALVNRLRATRSSRVVTVVAPAGYGKTTVLAQWASRDGRPFAWLSLDERDDEPAVLLRHLAAALNELEPLAPEVLEALTDRLNSVWTSAVPRVMDALESFSPCGIVLDNASLLHSKGAAELIAAVADHLPPASTLVLAGRAEPGLGTAALRAEGRLVELGHDLLALNRREAELLVRATGVMAAPTELETLVDQGAGWPAGLYLAALDDRFLGDYFRQTCLEGAGRATMEFLLRTSVLEKLSGPLCDAVLGRTQSSLRLASLHRRGLFLFPSDRRREWYRYQPLFRDLLRRELDERQPGAARELLLRAADWFEREGDTEAAVASAVAAGDLQRAARLIASVCDGADDACIERWLTLIGPDTTPELEALASQVCRAPEVEAHDTPPALTAAERRLLPLLATHLSFPEIGERLFLSRHTVKTQAISTYRKLGVSSRSGAVGAAAALGLL
jgi:LuxR family maltose regulon positive regulatory protein